MSFSEFNKQTALTESGVFVINEGIDHFESLPHDKFIQTVKSLSDFIISEKLDGSNLVFGFDNDGKFYTSREAKNKNGNRYHSVSDYSDRAADNGFKSAHAALEKVKSRLRAHVQPGEAVETEVLFGRQPNAIVYGSNYIAFLRALPGDSNQAPNQEVLKDLDAEFKGSKVTVSVPITTTDDGVEIKTENTSLDYGFASVSYIDSHHFKSVDVKKELDEFENWLAYEGETGIKNGDLLTIKLTSIPKGDRPTIKAAREEAIRVANKEFKLPIKEKFLNEILRKLAPALRDVDVEPHEDLGIEGVVLLNKHTLEQLKIVDKDVFTTINQFNHAIRNQVKFAVGKRPNFDTANLPTENDVFGDMLQKIEGVVGIDGIGRYANIKRVIRKIAGENDAQTIKNIANKFKVKNVGEAKNQVGEAIKEGIGDLATALNHYKQNWEQISTKLQTGADVKYTEEIHKRTLMVFAEVRQEMLDMLERTQNAKTLGGIVVALFGRQIKEIH